MSCAKWRVMANGRFDAAHSMTVTLSGVKAHSFITYNAYSCTDVA